MDGKERNRKVKNGKKSGMLGFQGARISGTVRKPRGEKSPFPDPVAVTLNG
jgi:hypothetical protein